MIVDILNVFVIVLYVCTFYWIYNHMADLFALLVLPFTFWIQLLISSAYIESGIFLIDFLEQSYATGFTIRFFLLLELQLIVIVFAFRKAGNVKDEKFEGFSKRQEKLWNLICMSAVVYLLINVLVSGNIFTTSSVTRFNFYSTFSRFPYAQPISYFTYSFSFIQGNLFAFSNNRKQKKYSLIYLSLVLLQLFLIGIQFGGYFINVIMFATPMISKLTKFRKLIKVKYIIIASVIVVIMLIPKYNYFSTTEMYESTGITNSYELLIYRALGQGADLPWKLDCQILEENMIDPSQVIEELKSLWTGNSKDVGVDYLMYRACPSTVYNRYSVGGAAITGGYPMIWIAMFGYVFGLIPVIIDAMIYGWFLFKMNKALKDKRLMRGLMFSFIYVQIYSIIGGNGIWVLGGLLPKTFIILLFISDRYRFSIGKRKIM